MHAFNVSASTMHLEETRPNKLKFDSNFVDPLVYFIPVPVPIDRVNVRLSGL